MKKKVLKEVEVSFCDFCNEEAKYLEKCVICLRDMCMEEGGKKHSAYSLEIYRYSDGIRLPPSKQHICKRCADRKIGTTVSDFLDTMIN